MSDQPSLFARDDTLFGVCQGIGEEIGLNPLWLRVAFALGLFWNAAAIAVAYLALGVMLMLFRRVFPTQRAAAPAAMPAMSPRGDNDDGAAVQAEAA